SGTSCSYAQVIQPVRYALGAIPNNRQIMSTSPLSKVGRREISVWSLSGMNVVSVHNTAEGDCSNRGRTETRRVTRPTESVRSEVSTTLKVSGAWSVAPTD